MAMTFYALHSKVARIIIVFNYRGGCKTSENWVLPNLNPITDY